MIVKELKELIKNVPDDALVHLEDVLCDNCKIKIEAYFSDKLDGEYAKNIKMLPLKIIKTVTDIRIYID